MSICVRFAPSPTGLLHVGNARTALVTWLFARHNEGKFLLRMDDTDGERSSDTFAEAIHDDLVWMGLDWDMFARQAGRLAEYEKAIDKLKDSGRLYPCYETPEELALKRKSQLGRGLPPIYDRGALKLSDAEKEKYEAQGRKPHWRFKLNHAKIEWNDLVRGHVHFEGADMSDPVLIREDGSPLYHICSVVDDIEFGITHIVRGEDHVSNTACHIQMFEALGATPPEFAHLPLLADKDGGKLSKRLGSLSVASLRDDDGIEPMALASLLARLGTSDAIEAETGMFKLIESFDFEKFSRGAPKFDPEELKRLNARILHETPFEEVHERLAEMGLDGIDEEFWNAVRPNLARFSEVADWWQIAKGEIEPVIEDGDYTKEAAALLPEEPWNTETWSSWVNGIKDQTGRKGKQLFMPLRQALTGQAHGPELGQLLPLIGRERAVARLKGSRA